MTLRLTPTGITIDAYAVAPYLNGNSISTLMQTATTREWNEFKQRADARGIALICYEGGSHQTTGDVIGVSLDPQMYSVYEAYLNNLDNYFSLYNEYTITRDWASDGAFGAKRYTAQPMAQAHKYRALYDYGIAGGQIDPDAPRPWESLVGTNHSSPRPARTTKHVTPGAQLRVHDLRGRLLRGHRGTSSVTATGLSRGVYVIQSDQTGVILLETGARR